MKLNCGLTPYERMEKEYRDEVAEVARATQWHRVFAWLPKRVSKVVPNHYWGTECYVLTRDCRWLEMVEVKYPSAERDWRGGVRYGTPVYRALDSSDSGKPLA